MVIPHPIWHNVEQVMQRYLYNCFARVKCKDRAQEHLPAISCKRSYSCPAYDQIEVIEFRSLLMICFK